MEDRIEMSAREREVLKVMSGVLRGERTQREAARLLRKTERQVRRIQRRLEAEGDRGVVHRLRGRPSNRRFQPELREQVLEAYRHDDSDFGPTLASEKLRERGREIRPDTLRRWLLQAGLILANSPQAKGRVERLFRTLQDRWVKELRLEKVTTREAANALLDRKLVREFHRKFRHRPQSPNDAHRALRPEHDLPAILSFQTTRRVNNDYTVRLRNRIHQRHKPAWPGLRGGRVVMEERRDGTLAIRFKCRTVPFRRQAES